MNNIMSIYILPPTFSLLCALYLVFLALTRGPRTREKVLFSLVCVWNSLLAPIFICHHLISDLDLILSIERKVHFFYVFLPFVTMVFVHHLLDIRRKVILLVLFCLSALFALTTQGDLYLTGLYKYSWGYIAKGGPAFQLFGLYGAAAMVYFIYLFARRLKVEANPKLRLKFIYILSSFGLAALMTFFNIPAMHGVDIYPPGNFSFLPMAVLAYGVLKHRQVQLRSLVQSTVLRVILIILILLPNIYIYDWSLAHVKHDSLPSEIIFLCLIAWFFLNHYALIRADRLAGRLLSKTRRQLEQAEVHLIKEMLVLSQVEHLSKEVSAALRANLPFAWARIFVYDEGSRQLADVEGECHDLPEALVPQLMRLKGIFEDQIAKPTPETEFLIHWLSGLKADYVVPLVHKESLVGLLALPHKGNRQPIHADEARFIKNIAQTLALAIANALMFQRISALKDNLQVRSDLLSQEIAERKRAEKSLKEVQDELEEANLTLEKAILQANEMTSKMEVSNFMLTKEMEERKRVEGALRESEAMHRLIAENSTDVIWTIDLHGRFTYVSPSIRHLLRYSPQEILTLGIKDVLTPASYELATQVIAQELALLSKPEAALRKNRTTEVEQVRKDGTAIWTEVNTRFIKDEHRRISGILGVTRDISDRRKAEQELLYLAYHDALTGLYNRKAFIELLENEIKYAQRYDSGLALLFFDLNRFKQVNDTFGHEIGDRLLKAVGDRVKAAVRESDIVFRLGGDEFTIILKTPEEIQPDVVVRRILDNLARPYRFDPVLVEFMSASIGIAVFPRDGATADELIKNADTAMYEAKKSNIDWCIFAPEMSQTVRYA